jgi:hypothetical protein
MVDELITTGYKNVSMNWGNFSDAVSAVNNSGAGYTFTIITFLVFLIISITLSATFGFEAGLLAGAFIGFIISILFVYAGVMSWTMSGVFVGIILVGIMYIIWKQN